MKLIYKKLGETPLEALDNLRASNPSLKNETLSYIGRLDPMAEGEMIVLVGKAENQKRDQFLHFDKEYTAEFLVGFSTDTGDLLGLVKENSRNIFSPDFLKSNDGEILQQKIKILLEKLLEITYQKFPWFSSKHVFGRALFDWFKSGESHEIERPIKEIKIYSAVLGETRQTSVNDLKKYLTENIAKVHGDFRQTEILNIWQETLDGISKDVATTSQYSLNTSQNTPNWPIFTLKLKVSTGTYIRGLTEEISLIIGQPVVLFSLKREHILFSNHSAGGPPTRTMRQFYKFSS